MSVGFRQEALNLALRSVCHRVLQLVCVRSREVQLVSRVCESLDHTHRSASPYNVIGCVRMCVLVGSTAFVVGMSFLESWGDEHAYF